MQEYAEKVSERPAGPSRCRGQKYGGWAKGDTPERNTEGYNSVLGRMMCVVLGYTKVIRRTAYAKPV